MLFLDYYYFYAAGLILSMGNNPYDISLYTKALTQLGYPASKAILPFPYPPHGLWIFYLLTVLPFWTSLTAFLSATLATIFQVYSMCRNSFLELFPWCSLPKLFLLFVLFPPFLKLAFFGQISWIPYVCYCAGFVFLSKDRHFVGGLLLSFLTLKPQIWIPVFGFIIGLSTKHKLLMPGLFLGFLIQCLLSLAIFPGLAADVMDGHFFHSIQASLAHVVSIAPVDGIASFTGIELLRPLVAVAAFFLGLYLSKKNFSLLRVSLFLLPALSLACAPYSWGHDYISLFPAVVFALFSVMPGISERRFLYLWSGASLVLLAGLAFQEHIIVLLLLMVLLRFRLIYEHCLQRNS